MFRTKVGLLAADLGNRETELSGAFTALQEKNTAAVAGDLAQVKLEYELALQRATSGAAQLSEALNARREVFTILIGTVAVVVAGVTAWIAWEQYSLTKSLTHERMATLRLEQEDLKAAMEAITPRSLSVTIDGLAGDCQCTCPSPKQPGEEVQCACECPPLVSASR